MKKILIIDDSSFQRKIVTSILREAGYEVITAGDGREGLALAKSEAPDMVISDLLMPEFDGFYLLKEAGTCRLPFPILIQTSDVQDSTREKCIGLGAAGLVNKPVKKEILLPAIEKILAGGRL